MSLIAALIFHLIPFAQLPLSPVVDVESAQMELIGDKVLYLEDPSGKLSVDDVIKLSKQGLFIPSSNTVFNRSPTESAFWFRLTVRNKTEQEIWLQIGDAFSTWELDFYTPDSNGRYSAPLLLGSLRPQENKVFDSNYFCVPLLGKDERKSKTFYVRVYGEFPKTHVFKVGSVVSLSRLTQGDNFVRASFIGVMLAMIMYNLFLLFSIKEKIYLYYVGYLISAIFIIPFINGHPLVYLDWLWEYYFVYQGSMALLVNLFAVNYLNLRKLSRKLYHWLWSLVIIVLLAGLFNVFFTDQFNIIITVIQPVLMVFNVSLLFAGIYALSQGQKNARFYVLGWSFVILGMITFILTINGLLSLNQFTSNVIYFGFSLEAVMFGLALGDRWQQQKIHQMKLQNSIEKSELEIQQQTLHMINVGNRISEIEEGLKDLKRKDSLVPGDIQKLISKIMVNRSMEKEWETLEHYFSKNHGDFKEMLYAKHDNLTIQERRLSILIRMDLTNREMASILNIEQRSVVMNRYRLKKKLGLAEKDSLEQYMQLI